MTATPQPKRGGRRAGAGRPRAGTVQIATRAPGELVARLDAVCDELGIDRSEAMRDALADWIAARDKGAA